MATHHILLTGANGFIAWHVLVQLLTSPAKHSVRAVVRSASKIENVKATVSSLKLEAGQLDFAIVEDITIAGAFDKALASEPPFDIVMHTASPFLFKAASHAQDFLGPAIKGTTEILSGIQRVAADTVKRVILTSSFAAVGSFGLTDERNKRYAEEDWNPVTFPDAQKSEDKTVVYYASKKFAELAAWEAQKKAGVNDMNESNARVWTQFLEQKRVDEEIPGDFVFYVDVRDIAWAHVRAMEGLEAGNQRFNICAGTITSQEIADILRSEVAGAGERTPRGQPGKKTLPAEMHWVDSSKAERVLDIQWRSKMETIRDLGRQLLEMEGGGV